MTENTKNIICLIQIEFKKSQFDKVGKHLSIEYYCGYKLLDVYGTLSELWSAPSLQTLYYIAIYLSEVRFKKGN